MRFTFPVKVEWEELHHSDRSIEQSRRLFLARNPVHNMRKERRQFVKGKESHGGDLISSGALEANEMAIMRPSSVGASGAGSIKVNNSLFQGLS
jgi:hypothetical protein